MRAHDHRLAAGAGSAAARDSVEDDPLRDRDRRRVLEPAHYELAACADGSRHLVPDEPPRLVHPATLMLGRVRDQRRQARSVMRLHAGSSPGGRERDHLPAATQSGQRGASQSAGVANR
jgi:hypothetical protein